MEFQSSLQKLQRSPCWHYSYESLTIQITPRRFSNSNNQVPGRVRAGGGGLTGQNRRRRSPAARVGLGEMESRPRRTSGCTWCVGRGSEEGGRRWTAVWRRSAKAGTALRWTTAEEIGPMRTSEASLRCWWGLFGSSRGGGVAPRASRAAELDG